MSTEVETLPTLAAFARPTSLYLPDVPRSASVLDTSSYSPFPTFPGSIKTRDPYGLNAYLLHPDDSLWSYVDPLPQGSSAQEHQRSASLDELNAGLSMSKTVRKQRSLSLLRRPSPLGVQPPVSAESSENEDEKPQLLVRKRSSSIGSSPKLSLEEAAAVVATFRDEIAVARTPKSKKSLRKAFSKARKSVFGMTDGVGSVPPVPAMPELPALVAPSIAISSSEDFAPSTPMSSRSNSNYSTMSSASSTSSSEGVKTPGEGISMDVTITGTKLANALQEAGGLKKGKTWSRWLGGKKGKTVAKEAATSGSNTPVSDASSASTPNSSSPDLLAGALPKVTLTPSPAIITSSSKATSLVPATELLSSRQHTWATEQLRRISIRKISQLKAPSPHPLALALRRQHSRLPEEVASHIQAGQRVFPMSVNSCLGSDGDLSPAQGGLRLNLAIGGILIKLDRGEQPDGLFRNRKISKRSIVRRPRGVHDFITRPPFEERNIVYYPENIFSPISMARPGYGVWDLDFSPYILALSEVDEPPTPWPHFPRVSIAATDELADIITATTLQAERIDEEDIEMLSSPTFKHFAQASEAALEALSSTVDIEIPPAPSTESFQDASPCSSPVQQPLSSFRNLSTMSNSSGSISDEESAEGSDEDDEPLAQLANRRSSNLQPKMSASNHLARRDQLQNRSLSRPEPRFDGRKFSRNAAQRQETSHHHTTMEQVAQARERREQNLLGAAERKAESDQMRKHAEKRLSLSNLSAPKAASKHRRAASGDGIHSDSSRLPINRPPSVHISHASSQQHMPSTFRADDTHRHRLMSGNERGRHLSVSRPDVQRGRSNPEQSSRRYHSFYEQQAASISAPTFNSLPRPEHRSSQTFNPHAFSVQPHRMSMVLPQQMMPQYPPTMYPFPGSMPPMNGATGGGSVNKRSSWMA